MTPREAAEIIGCSPQQVRTLIRKGKLRAKQKPYVGNGLGYCYDITQREAERYRDKETGGWPRGESRNE